MTAQAVPPPDFTAPAVDKDGFLTRAWQAFLTGLYMRSGGNGDKVEAAHALSLAAAPQSTQVIAAGGLQVGGDLTGNVAVALYVVLTSVALLPTAAGLGEWAYAMDGRKNGEGSGAGTGTPVWWDGTAWIAPDTGASVAA